MEKLIVVILTLIIISSGCTSRGNLSKGAEKNVQVYVQLLMGDGTFYMADFHLNANGKVINSTLRPVLVYSGPPGLLYIQIVGWGYTWWGGNITLGTSYTTYLNSSGEYLVSLKLKRTEHGYSLEVDNKYTGYLGRNKPKKLVGGINITTIMKKFGLFEDYLEVERKSHRLASIELENYRKTGNISYLQMFRDLEYHQKLMKFLEERGKLTAVAARELLLDMKATVWYYEHYRKPGHKDLTLIFDNFSPYHETILAGGHFPLPFVYYRARGFNLYPVSALHWAQIYYKRNETKAFLNILGNLSEFVETGSLNNVKYALFKIYFNYQNSTVPWVSGYAQGLAAGLYALAYNMTGNKTYLGLANLFMNSFKLPLNSSGFVENTTFGEWCLEYAYYPKQLVLNGHIICTQGVYYYWLVTGSRSAEKTFERLTESVARALPYFDLGNWSRYASIYNTASVFYHRLHIKLLVWLYVKTEKEVFLKYAKRWNEYLVNRNLKPENIQKLIEEARKDP